MDIILGFISCGRFTEGLWHKVVEVILRRVFGPLHEDGRFRRHDCLVLDKIRLNRLRWADNLICMKDDDSARKVFKGRKRDVADVA